MSKPPFMRVKELEDIKKFSKLHDFPFVLKPVDGRGSKGVVILKSFSDVKKFFHIPQIYNKEKLFDYRKIFRRTPAERGVSIS